MFQKKFLPAYLDNTDEYNVYGLSFVCSEIVLSFIMLVFPRVKNQLSFGCWVILFGHFVWLLLLWHFTIEYFSWADIWMAALEVDSKVFTSREMFPVCDNRNSPRAIKIIISLVFKIIQLI